MSVAVTFLETVAETCLGEHRVGQMRVSRSPVEALVKERFQDRIRAIFPILPHPFEHQFPLGRGLVRDMRLSPTACLELIIDRVSRGHRGLILLAPCSYAGGNVELV